MSASLIQTMLMLIIASVLVKSSLQCSLLGELCGWNIFDFDHIINPDGSGAFLHSASKHSYVESPLYANSTQSKCVVHISYTLSEGTELKLMQTEENTKYRGDNLREQVSYNRGVLATLFHNDTYRIISIPRTDNSFKLKLMLMSGKDVKEINATIRSVNLAYCTPESLLKYSPQCTPRNGRECSGWKILTHPPESLFRWEVEDGNYTLMTNETTSTSYWTKLQSPTWPYRSNSQCEWSYEYRLNAKVTSYVIYIHLYSSNGTRVRNWGHMDDAFNSTNGEWKTVKQSLNDQGEPVTSFQIEIRTYEIRTYEIRTDEKNTYSKVYVRNFSVSESCFPQLPLQPHDSLEALLSMEIQAANLSVAHRATSYSFRTCGSSGSSGPTSTQCKEYYKAFSKPFVDVKIDDTIPGVQQWIVPKTNDYDVILFGAVGGFGIDTNTAPGMVRGYAEYYRHNKSNLPLWPTKMHLKLKLYEKEKLYIVVGQAGSTACRNRQGDNCGNENKTALGGGGAGGGASMVLIERDGETILVGIAGGGGGMGRKDLPAKDYLFQHKHDCEGNNLCRDRHDRPGFGGSYYMEDNSSQPLLLPQDGRPLSWPFDLSNSLLGGRGCYNYSEHFDTRGGFGGGGGGCTAGGGGGGYQGGRVSVTNNASLPGLQGSSYHNENLTELVHLSQHAPFALAHPHGWVEITEVPPPCECGERPCRYLYPNYTDYNCLCDKQWVSKHRLYTCETDPMHADQITDTVIAVVMTLSGIIVVIVLLTVVVRVRQRRRKRTVMGHVRIKMDENPSYPSYEGAPDTLAWERIKFIRILGEGNFSKVFEARLALSDSWNSPEIIVAVKQPKENTVLSRAEFLQEARIISAFNHPNIMKIIGTCELPDGNIGIAMDVLKGGNLRAFLKENKPIGEKSPCTLLYGDLIRIAFEISSACKYLEEMKYIHRDLAARNVLLTEKGKMRVAKISDFGLSRDVNQGDYCRRSPMRDVPIRWYPPEAIKINHMQTTKSDVWSYGVLLWEIFTLGDQPYPGMENYQVAERIAQGYTMDPPTACPRPIGDLMRRCWMYEAKDRPAFSFIHLQFNRLLQNEALMNSSLGDLKHWRGSVTSSVSSGFDEMPDSPSCLSIKPLLDVSYHNGSESGISNIC